jgi:pyruvate/2-oxoglutarate dehydrogenase complex dihydrolipoamide dehydrogenase (E3) component
MFTDPELGRVGLDEAEAEQRGIATRLARVPMGRNSNCCSHLPGARSGSD